MKEFKFDYVSDLHIDLTIGKGAGTTLEHLFSKAESPYLLIAGDIGHHLEQNIKVLKEIKEKYNYKEVILVLGNHDRYFNRVEGTGLCGTGKKNRSTERYKQEGFVILDGDFVEIDGVTIGGADGWYDGSHGRPRGTIEEDLQYWAGCINDYSYKASINYYETFEGEIEKVKSLFGKCDIIMTHVRPTVSDLHVNPGYCGDESNKFFGFNYEETLSRDPKLKCWLFGHVHDPIEFEVAPQFPSSEHKVLLCNPFGYISENYGRTVKTHSIFVENDKCGCNDANNVAMLTNVAMLNVAQRRNNEEAI